jgi:hypothetical protein
MFFITCFSRCEKDERGFFRGGAQRTFGFKETFEDAKYALNQNVCDMHEYLYTYAVVEEMRAGIHPDVESEVWFQWNEKEKGFFQIEKPKETYGVCNFALG